MHLVFNTVQSLLRGYKSFWHVLPTWIEEGLGNWVVREADPEAHNFSGMREWDTTKEYPTKWDVYARRLSTNGFAPTAAKLCELREPQQFTLNDHICAWSRIDFLLSLDDGKQFAAFLAGIKAPLPQEPGQVTTIERVMVEQKKLVQSVFGMSYEEFDTAWTRYTQTRYPRR
jgi:hypothetical protein